MDRELRYMRCREIRAAPAEGGMRFEGYAAMFNSPSEDFGGWVEYIAPGAFQHLEEDDVRCLFDHDSKYVLGRNQSGTLELRQDETGLWFSVTAPDTGWARDLHESVARGDIDQCSFAFSVVEDGQHWTVGRGGEPDIRTLTDLHLYDVSIVTYPAYQATSVSARSLELRNQAHAEADAEANTATQGHGDPDILRRRLELKIHE